MTNDEIKTINVTFSAKEYKNLLLDKGEQSWREYILNKIGQVTEIEEEKPKEKKKNFFVR